MLPTTSHRPAPALDALAAFPALQSFCLSAFAAITALIATLTGRGVERAEVEFLEAKLAKFESLDLRVEDAILLDIESIDADEPERMAA